MGKITDYEPIDFEVLKKLAHTVDFVIYLVELFNELLKKLCENLKALPSEIPTIGVSELLL